MHRYLNFIIVLCFVSTLVACGNGNKSTAGTPVPVLPVTGITTPQVGSVGGSVQSTAGLTLAGTVSTIAGTAKTAGFLDYSSASVVPAKFFHPTDITTDGTDFYVTDFENNAIRQITKSGVVRNLVCTTDGATSAYFHYPSSLTIKGNKLYVVDSGSNSIRIIDLNTKIVTTIGSTTGYGGYVDSAVAADVRFYNPIGVTTDGVNVYVTDTGNHAVRYIDAANAVYTLAGASGVAGSSDGKQAAATFNKPARITTDGVNLYLTDFGNRAVRKIVIATGDVTTIAGAPGPLGADEGTLDAIGIAARFNQPNGITTDGVNLYVTDSYTNSIRKIVIATGVVSTVISGNYKTPGYADSPATPLFDTPIGIATDGTALYIADSQNNTIRKMQ